MCSQNTENNIVINLPFPPNIDVIGVTAGWAPPNINGFTTPLPIPNAAFESVVDGEPIAAVAKHELANVFSNENVDANVALLLSESDDNVFIASPNTNDDDPLVILFVVGIIDVDVILFPAPKTGVKLKIELVSLFTTVDENVLLPKIFFVNESVALFSENDICVNRLGIEFALETFTLNSLPKIFFVDSLVLLFNGFDRSLTTISPLLLPNPVVDDFKIFWFFGGECIIFIGGITSGNGLSSEMFELISLISANWKSSGLQPRHPLHFVIGSSVIDAVLVVSFNIELSAEPENFVILVDTHFLLNKNDLIYYYHWPIEQ